MYTHLCMLLVWFPLSFPHLIQILSPMEGNESYDFSKLTKQEEQLDKQKMNSLNFMLPESKN